MKASSNVKRNALWILSFVIILLTKVAMAGPLASMVDDFSDAANNNLGFPRQHLNDQLAGGGTLSQQKAVQGVLRLSGSILPPRGQPGWASSVLPIDPKGLPRDASHFQGIRLIIKIDSGNVSLSANSTEVNNFDYHSAPVVVPADGQFHEVKIPFSDMKRTWSDQTSLNTATITSLSITAYALKKQTYSFEVDEVGFY